MMGLLVLQGRQPVSPTGRHGLSSGASTVSSPRHGHPPNTGSAPQLLSPRHGHAGGGGQLASPRLQSSRFSRGASGGVFGRQTGQSTSPMGGLHVSRNVYGSHLTRGGGWISVLLSLRFTRRIGLAVVLLFIAMSIMLILNGSDSVSQKTSLSTDLEVLQLLHNDGGAFADTGQNIITETDTRSFKVSDRRVYEHVQGGVVDDAFVGRLRGVQNARAEREEEDEHHEDGIVRRAGMMGLVERHGLEGGDRSQMLTWNARVGQRALQLAQQRPSLKRGHKCEDFSVPPTPNNTKKTGPRPCPVCFVPMNQAIAAMPEPDLARSPVLRHLTYADRNHPSERVAASLGLPNHTFGGHQTLLDRAESFNVKESMEVHCGFVAMNSGFDIYEEDRRDMDGCKGIVVVSAIFGRYDLLQQPVEVGEEAQRNVCFYMFVDEDTLNDLTNDNDGVGHKYRTIGIWRIVLVRNMPYKDPRRNGKVPKLLLHRLFPNARFSLWIDAKLRLQVDPYQIMERFLWRQRYPFAISNHYRRFDIFREAEANKAAGKYKNASIDRQIEFYRSEGMTYYTQEKLPIPSDVPEGCVLIREHLPLTNLFSCLWFNEVERFTSRDQLSFGYTRDKMSVPLDINMFMDCERRNIVVQIYHKELLLQKAGEKAQARAMPMDAEAGGGGGAAAAAAGEDYGERQARMLRAGAAVGDTKRAMVEREAKEEESERNLEDENHGTSIDPQSEVKSYHPSNITRKRRNKRRRPKRDTHHVRGDLPTAIQQGAH